MRSGLNLWRTDQGKGEAGRHGRRSKCGAEGLDAALLERVKRSEFFGRDGNVPGLGFNMDMARAVFSEEGKNAVTGAKWNAEPWRMEDGAVLVRLAAVEEPSAEEWKAAEPWFLSQLGQQPGLPYCSRILSRCCTARPISRS